MTYEVIRKRGKPRHSCHLPSWSDSHLGLGAIIRCSECGRRWQRAWGKRSIVWKRRWFPPFRVKAYDESEKDASDG